MITRARGLGWVGEEDLVQHGVVLFAAMNRLNVVPPANTPVDDAKAGLALIDEALAVADSYVTG